MRANKYLLSVVAVALLHTTAVLAQLDVTVTDIGPNSSTLDATNPNGASGGRVNGLAADPGNNQILYAASEWGGLFKSTDGGNNWSRLNGHVPAATWDVAVDPSNSQRVIATSFYDGRVFSQSGINVSFDGGVNWSHPPTATPPAGFCLNAARRTEPSAFGISFDPANPQNVYVGTNCGLAVSIDGGVNWNFIDPTPGDRADDVWDVVVHDGGIIDLCGDDGHQRSIDGGANWTPAAGFPRPAGGRCSIDVSPDEPYVIFVVSGVTIWESDDGGTTWATFANPAPQGRIPFVAVNDRTGTAFDLWFGDVQLFRAGCTTPSPPATGGIARCPASNTWTNSQTGAHWDAGDLAFNSQATVDACPMLYSNDGGVYFETQGTSPACHAPSWEQPAVTPHALWQWDLEGASETGPANEDIYFGNQDTGTFGAIDAPNNPPTWTNRDCCDGFDVAAETGQVVYTLCCFGGVGARFNQVRVRGAGMVGGAAFTPGDYPAGNVPIFNLLDSIANFGGNSYAMITTAGVFVTQNINVVRLTGLRPVVNWVQLGAATTPANTCGIQAATAGGTTTFFVKSGGCDGSVGGSLWSYVGITAGGNWQQITRNGNSQFGVYAVDSTNPQRIIASDLATAVPQMVISTDGGSNWQQMPALDNLMTAGGLFQYQNQRGEWVSPGLFVGYPQPSLVAFDPEDPNIVVAGAIDAGVFLSVDGGTTWELVTDPINPGVSGTPHIPRPHDAFFDHEPAGRVSVYVGTVGRGAWRISFESPGPGAVAVVPVGWEFDYKSKDHHINEHSLRILNTTLNMPTSTLNWNTRVKYMDKNADDDYRWEASHGLLNLRDAFVQNGDTSWLNKTGNVSTHDETLTSSDLVGFDSAIVVLRGWHFDYSSKDHQINVIGIRLTNIQYDSNSGTISWRAEAEYADKNFDDGYRWRYQWQVIALNGGAFRTATRNGSDGGGTDVDSGSVTDSSLQGFETVAVLPLGWRFDYDSKDHHINENGFQIRNIQYNALSGSVSWVARLNYSDKNFDDNYSWRYDVAVLGFNNGSFTILDHGPFEDNGGADQESFSAVIP